METAVPANALKYVPVPKVQRVGKGLALSGGGFRATLFHLGALRRLNELGILKQMRTISSVSGGSILNGFLASRLPSPLNAGVADFTASVSSPMREFCAQDLRRWLALESVVPGTHDSLGLAKHYDATLTKGKTLATIPSDLAHVLCSTDLVFGVNWMFKRDQSGDYMAGFQNNPADWKLSTAVAASSCFPPVFKPINLNLDPTKMQGGRAQPGPVRDKLVREITLSDGGVYDNLGVEPIWKDHEYVFASDGGALFKLSGDNGFLWDVGRFVSIPENQALAVRKRWLISSFIAGEMKGAYWGIGSSCQDYGVAQGYSEDLAKKYIAAIRTDLDSFSDAEASVLENHGYWLADAAIKTHSKELLPQPVPALQVPNPEWGASDEEKIKAALKDSGHRSLLGRAS
jgi:NTE family protein